MPQEYWSTFKNLPSIFSRGLGTWLSWVGLIVTIGSVIVGATGMTFQNTPTFFHWLGFGGIAGLFILSLHVLIRELTPKLKILTGPHEPYYQEGHLQPATYIFYRLYRIGVANLSKTMPINNVTVKVISIEPRCPTIFPPFSLKRMHNDPPDNTLYEEIFHLNAGEEKHFDLIQQIINFHSKETTLQIIHTVRHQSRDVSPTTISRKQRGLSKNGYTLKIQVTGHGVPAEQATFVAKVNQDSKLILEHQDE